MADYARIYGFRTYTYKEIRKQEDEFTRIDRNCYIKNSDLDLLEEILDNEN